MTFNDWWTQYLKAGGIEHFNLMADEESALAAWLAACEACAALAENVAAGRDADAIAEAIRKQSINE